MASSLPWRNKKALRFWLAPTGICATNKIWLGGKLQTSGPEQLSKIASRQAEREAVAATPRVCADWSEIKQARDLVISLVVEFKEAPHLK